MFENRKWDKDTFADFIKEEAKVYCLTNLLISIVPKLEKEHARITVDTVKKIIDPFLKEINPRLTYHDNVKLEDHLNNFAPIAFGVIRANNDIHKGDGTDIINENNAVAILAVFIYLIYEPLIIDLRSEELVTKEGYDSLILRIKKKKQ